MHKNLAVLAIFLAILSHSRDTSGQANLASAPPGDAGPEATGSNNSNKTEDKRDVSPQATAEAKRLFKEAVKYGRGGLSKQASELFERAVQLNPNYAEAHYALGQAYFDQSRWEDSIRCFENGVKINPKDKNARARLGEAYAHAAKNKKPALSAEESVTSTNLISTNAWSESRARNITPASVTPPSVAPIPNTPPGVSPPSVTPSLNVATEAHPDAASAAGIDLTRVYHIGIGDVLDVRLGHEPASQSTLFTITPSGQLEHPILSSPLQVSGLTVEEARTRLEADLKRRAVNENPRVLIGVREYLSHAIIVSGLVKEPGTKLLRREAIPLYVVIADAQPAPDAGRATLIRHETGETMVADLSKPTEMNLLVRSGDVITVQETPKQFFYVGGEVKAPGEKQFRAGVTLTQAILTAGGLSRECSTADIARAREKGFLASTRYKLKDINTGKLADPLIQAGDRITVEH